MNGETNIYGKLCTNKAVPNPHKLFLKQTDVSKMSTCTF